MNGLRHDSNPTKLGLMDCAGLVDAYLIGMSEGPNFDTAMERRFQEYVDHLGTVVGNDARRRGLSDYMTGLLLPGERKSMEPIAERLESGNVSRRHQSIQHFVSEASWKDGPVRERVLGRVVPAMQKRGTIEHWIIDDTTLLKSGRHSVGVAIQYSGLVGTTANCQSLVSLSLATEAVSMPVACELYLPEDWAHDRKRRLQAGVPPHLTFRTKIEMAIDQIRHAVAAGLPRGIGLADAAYGGRPRPPPARAVAARRSFRRRPDLPRRAEGPRSQLCARDREQHHGRAGRHSGSRHRAHQVRQGPGGRRPGRCPGRRVGAAPLAPRLVAGRIGWTVKRAVCGAPGPGRSDPAPGPSRCRGMAGRSGRRCSQGS